jgi:HD-GYP domain-containing protein (c-di-GMP phosphodiesterase class II)
VFALEPDGVLARRSAPLAGRPLPLIGRMTPRRTGFVIVPRSMAGQMTMPADAPWMAQAVETLAHELREHHAPTADHSHRLAAHARVVAETLRLDPLDATEVELVAVLHDVGKLAVDPDILDWPGPLDERRRERMRRHTIEGEEMLAGIAGLEHLAPAVRATHEAWDGSGYPDGLAGVEIPLTARIVTVVDAFDAMTSERAYREPLPRREALRRLRAGAGMQFDPRVVNALLRVV